MQAAQQQAAQTAQAGADEDKENENESSGEDAAERIKRKRKEEAALKKIKASKEFKKRKFEHLRDNPDADSDDDNLAKTFMKESKVKAPPKPGQLASCEFCEKRFTVTAYTLAGPDGGLLCTPCGKNVKDEKKKTDHAAKKKKTVPKARKRQTESDRMMGDVQPGAKSLVEHCIKKVADVVNDIEEFGDLPQDLLDRLSQILSKKRVLTPRTLQLFLKNDIDRIAVYDCAKLESEDFQKIFAFMPDVQNINLRFAGQLKDEQMRYMIDKNSKIAHLQLGATNLVTDEVWKELFYKRGSQLESLKLSELNDAFRGDMFQIMSEQCSNLKRIKLRSLHNVTAEAIDHLSNMTTLEHVSLAIGQEATAEQLTAMVQKLGPKLKTLSLEDYHDADNHVLKAIRENCTQLQKLRITGSSTCSDLMFAQLFDTTWSNPPIPFIDLSSNRDIDSADPEPIEQDDGSEDPQDYIGFCSAGLRALFQHSGSLLERLDLHSCRHVDHKALTDVFDGVKQYPHLRDIDLSFVTHVDEVVMSGIFKSCPALQKLAVFACFSAKDALIPPNIAVIGLPNAQAAVEIRIQE